MNEVLRGFPEDEARKDLFRRPEVKLWEVSVNICSLKLHSNSTDPQPCFIMPCLLNLFIYLFIYFFGEGGGGNCQKIIHQQRWCITVSTIVAAISGAIHFPSSTSCHVRTSRENLEVYLAWPGPQDYTPTSCLSPNLVMVSRTSGSNSAFTTTASLSGLSSTSSNWKRSF